MSLLMDDELYLRTYTRRDREMVARHYWSSLDAAEQLPFRRFSKEVIRRTWFSALGKLWLPRHLRYPCPPAYGASTYTAFLYRLRRDRGARYLTVPLGAARERTAMEPLLAPPAHGLWSGMEELTVRNLYRAQRAAVGSLYCHDDDDWWGISCAIQTIPSNETIDYEHPRRRRRRQ